MSEIIQSLGKLITTPQSRDAIHIAIAPVEASHPLRPGERIYIESGMACSEVRGNAIGIVDPFLKKNVLGGERFWMFLMPGTITSLRHEWTHPALKTESKLSQPRGIESVKQSMELLAESCSCSVQKLMERLDRYAEGGFGPDDSVHDGLNALSEFARVSMWDNYELIRGVSVDLEVRNETYFRCGC